MSDPFWWATVLGALVIGFLLGGQAEARLWRGKARDGFRMASGNALYVVTKVFDFDLPVPSESTLPKEPKA